MDGKRFMIKKEERILTYYAAKVKSKHSAKIVVSTDEITDKTFEFKDL